MKKMGLQSFKKSIKVIINILLLYFIILYTFLKRQKKRSNRIVILCDYLDVSLMLDSHELEDCDIFIITTRRYNFYGLLRKKRWCKISGVKITNDFSEKTNTPLLRYCKFKKIDCVLIQAGDFLVPSYNYLNLKLNNRGNVDKAVLCSLDKNIMRNHLNDHNIGKVNKIYLNSVADVEQVSFFPCVVKPNIGTASEGVIFVNNKNELKNAISISKDQQRTTEFKSSFLVEEYINGRQFDVEGLIDNGNVYILCVVEENYSGYTPFFNINWFMFNAFLFKDTLNKVKILLEKSFSACELKNGAFHCELKISESGDIRIIEFSNRMGGGFENKISRVTGNNFIDLYIRLMLDKPIEIKQNKHEYLLQKYFQSQKELNQWIDFCQCNKIIHKFNSLNRGDIIGVIEILNSNKSLMSIISDNFELGFTESL